MTTNYETSWLKFRQWRTPDVPLGALFSCTVLTMRALRRNISANMNLQYWYALITDCTCTCMFMFTVSDYRNSPIYSCVTQSFFLSISSSFSTRFSPRENLKFWNISHILYDSLDGGSARHNASCTGQHNIERREQPSLPSERVEPKIPVSKQSRPRLTPGGNYVYEIGCVLDGLK
jgi:hypothetical protein